MIDARGRIALSVEDWRMLATLRDGRPANRHDAKRLRLSSEEAVSVASDARTRTPGEQGARAAAAVLEPMFGPRHAAALALFGRCAFDYDPAVDAWLGGSPVEALPRDPHAGVTDEPWPGRAAPA